MAAITKSKRPLEEPQEERKVKVTKTKKQASPTSPTSPADFTTIMASQLALIEASTRTPFEKSVWTLLCQIPRGELLNIRYHGRPFKVVTKSSTGGALGGFKGKWPKDGEGITLDEKRKLLRGEGVRWDDKGKVIGTPFGGFT
ncbi:hypothetical protein QSH57_014126 [Fusarium oxysporum f. sp. vasinfectum]|nr:hypothetical protein QSH57_014126 [Fusarium oxysporum f. sp. vasinfectum]